MKNVQGRHSSSASNNANTIIIVFIFLGIIGVLAGTFVMVKGIKPSTTTTVPKVSVIAVTE